MVKHAGFQLPYAGLDEALRKRGVQRRGGGGGGFVGGVGRVGAC